MAVEPITTTKTSIDIPTDIYLRVKEIAKKEDRSDGQIWRRVITRGMRGEK